MVPCWSGIVVVVVEEEMVWGIPAVVAPTGAADLVATPPAVGAFWNTATVGGCPATPVDGWGGIAPSWLNPSPAAGPAVEGP